MGRMGIVVTAVMLAVAACGGETDGAGRSAPVVRDSAGIVVVETPAPDPGDPAFRRLDPAPLREVGTVDGPPATVLDGVVDPLLLGDGTLVLGDAGSRQIRAFAPDGTLRWTAGGEGDGPGEFRRLSWIGRLPGDSVIAWDLRMRRATVFGADGGLARTYATEPAEGTVMASPVAVLEGPRLLVSGGSSFSGGEGPAEEVVQPSVPHHLADLEGGILDSVAAVPGREVLVLRPGGGSVGVAALPMARDGFAAGADGVVALTTTERPEIRIHGPSGELRRIVRVGVQVPRAAPGDREAWLEHRLAEIREPAERQAARTRLEDLPYPETYPWLSALRVDDRGRIWIRRWTRPWVAAAESAEWWVFAADGTPLGPVWTPADLEVVRIQGERVVGVVRDDLGVERVRVYALGS